MKIFEESYSQLNAAQQEAVDHIEGPLLVVAGPGTGKTQLLSMRVANILRKTDTDPSTITCLTFTVNAANNMRERLRSIIGSTANQVVIKTFHSLAADIIASNPQHFYAGATLNPVSELAAQEIIQSIFDTLPHDNPLAVRYDDRYSYLGSALNAIGKAKDAGLTPKLLRETLQQNLLDIEALEPRLVEILAPSLSHKTLSNLQGNLESLLIEQPNNKLTNAVVQLLLAAIESDLPTTKSSTTSKLKTKLLKNEAGVKKLSGERRANTWWLALSNVYEAYQQALYKRGYLDYSDMLISVIGSLQENEDLRLDIQESMHYVLIDEFQDSNQAQITLAHLLTDNPAVEAPNIMAVGDPNQTIYGFNGAVLDNIDQFQLFYKDHLTTIYLTENYRSTQTILDNSKDIINPYTTYQPKLHANTPDGPTVRYAAYATPNDQAINVGKMAEEILDQNPNHTVAVLGRGHESLAYIARYLHSKQIAVNYEQVVDIRTTKANSIILRVAQLLQAMIRGDRQGSNYHLSLLLQDSVFALDANILWQIATAAHASRDWLKACLDTPATKPLVEWLQDLARTSAAEPINTIIEQILITEYAPNKVLYNQLFKYDDPEKTILESQATRKLIDIAKQYAQIDRVGIDELINITESTIQTRLFNFKPDVGRHGHAVDLMSVHAAKGLEFDHVIVIDADEKNWKPSNSRYPIPLNLAIHTALETAADYARLLYVAMTRAKQTLSVSYVHGQEGDTRALQAEQLTSISFDTVPPAQDEDFAQTTLSEVIFPRPTPKTMRQLLDTQLMNFKLSPTALTNFLDLTRGGPTNFVEHNLLKLPEPVSTTLIHGNAMHSAMELAQIQTINNKLDIAAIKRLYAKKVQAEGLSNQATERLIGKGEAQLEILFNDFGLSLQPTSLSEQSLSVILADNTPLYGKVDRLDIINTNTLRVVDYKTGKPLTTMTSRSEANRIKMWRHSLQLGFYVVLLKHTKRYTGKTYATQIIQLDAQDNEQVYLDYSISEAELNRVERLAGIVYQRIMDLHMPDVSVYEPTLGGIELFEQDLLDGKI